MEPLGSPGPPKEEQHSARHFVFCSWRLHGAPRRPKAPKEKQRSARHFVSCCLGLHGAPRGPSGPKEEQHSARHFVSCSWGLHGAPREPMAPKWMPVSFGGYPKHAKVKRNWWGPPSGAHGEGPKSVYRHRGSAHISNMDKNVISKKSHFYSDCQNMQNPHACTPKITPTREPQRGVPSKTDSFGKAPGAQRDTPPRVDYGQGPLSSYCAQLFIYVSITCRN